MAGDANRTEPTRRSYIKYGSGVVASGLLAGCSGSGGEQPTEKETETGTTTGTTADASYSVTMEPMGTVTFDEPPETWLSFLSTYGDMGIALGKADGLRGLWDPSNVPTMFYDYLPDVDVSLDDVAKVGGDGGLDKEIFYSLDCDVHVVDPNWLGVLDENWTADDTAEIEREVGPFIGNYIRRRGDEWHDYRYYSLYEAFELVADAFDESARYDAYHAAHEEMQSTIQSTLPPMSERPTVGLLSVNSDFETGSFWAYPVQPGNNHKQYRDLEIRGAFDAHIDGSYANWDYEQLLEVDPDAIVFQYGLTHVSTEEFEAKVERMRDDPVGKQLSAVQNDRLYRGGGSYQGPIVNLFQTEAAARQFYPDAFGEWNGLETLADDSLTLFDRQRIADILNGDI